MTFDSLTHAVSWLIGFALLVFFGALMMFEVRVEPTHTVHIAIFAVGMAVALIIMGFARVIADGLGAIGEKAGPYLPWRKS